MTRKRSVTSRYHRYTYGTTEIVGFTAPWRMEVYRPFEANPREPWNAAITERCMALGADDASPHHDKGSHYDARCPCCYLNITHTQALHAARTMTDRYGTAITP